MKAPLITVQAALAAMLLAPVAVGQVKFTTLYSFTGGFPTGMALIQGNLYGVAALGSCGNVFELQPPTADGEPWTPSTLYTFTGSPGGIGDACDPEGPLILGANGALYGIAESGGANAYGAMYGLQPPVSPGAPWTEIVAYSFNDYQLASGPPASLLVDGPGGSFYVLCDYQNGSLLQLLPPAAGLAWTGALLFDVGGAADSLIAGPHGELYGASAFGGEGAGNVFQLLPPDAPGGDWTEIVLHSFEPGGASDPVTPTLARDGTIYGVTYGTVAGWYSGKSLAYSLTPPTAPGQEWTYMALRPFLAGQANSQLVLHNGNLYGTLSTIEGGAVFEMQPPAAPGGDWTTVYLHQFTNGQVPTQLIVDEKGTVFGTSGTMDPYPSAGVIFEIQTQ